MRKNGKIFVISAPSGAGKTTLVNKVCDQIGQQCFLERVITYTTKKPRPNEQNGKDYHFLTVGEFEQKIQEGFFIEWSVAYGHYYGSPDYILGDMVSGKSFMIVVDKNGAQFIAQKISEAVLIWIYTKNIEILEKRLQARNTENNEQLVQRLALAREELCDERIKTLFKYYVLNDSFQRAVQEIESIVLQELNDEQEKLSSTGGFLKKKVCFEKKN